jgi:hypothetical protein
LVDFVHSGRWKNAGGLLLRILTTSSKDMSDRASELTKSPIVTMFRLNGSMSNMDFDPWWAENTITPSLTSNHCSCDLCRSLSHTQVSDETEDWTTERERFGAVLDCSSVSSSIYFVISIMAQAHLLGHAIPRPEHAADDLQLRAGAQKTNWTWKATVENDTFRFMLFPNLNY